MFLRNEVMGSSGWRLVLALFLSRGAASCSGKDRTPAGVSGPSVPIADAGSPTSGEGQFASDAGVSSTVPLPTRLYGFDGLVERASHIALIRVRDRLTDAYSSSGAMAGQTYRFYYDALIVEVEDSLSLAWMPADRLLAVPRCLTLLDGGWVPFSDPICILASSTVLRQADRALVFAFRGTAEYPPLIFERFLVAADGTVDLTSVSGETQARQPLAEVVARIRAAVAATPPRPAQGP